MILSKTGRDIPEEKALEYVLGYTASNDVSARTQQHNTSQWSFAKGEEAPHLYERKEVCSRSATQASMTPLPSALYWFLRLRYQTRTLLTLKRSTTAVLFKIRTLGKFAEWRDSLSEERLITVRLLQGDDFHRSKAHRLALPGDDVGKRDCHSDGNRAGNRSVPTASSCAESW